LESRLGIDYRSLARAPVAELLSQLEAERLEREGDVSAKPASQRKELETRWRQLILALLAGTLPPTFTGSASESSLDDLRALTPRSLARLKSCGPDADKRLDYLRTTQLRIGKEQE
jgi:hypothetical protein